jgi:hypothetical protein
MAEPVEIFGWGHIPLLLRNASGIAKLNKGLIGFVPATMIV